MWWAMGAMVIVLVLVWLASSAGAQGQKEKGTSTGDKGNAMKA